MKWICTCSPVTNRALTVASPRTLARSKPRRTRARSRRLHDLEPRRGTGVDGRAGREAEGVGHGDRPDTGVVGRQLGVGMGAPEPVEGRLGPLVLLHPSFIGSGAPA